MRFSSYAMSVTRPRHQHTRESCSSDSQFVIPRRIWKLLLSRSAGWRFRTRDDCRCNHRNSCSVDVRSDVFEEDPCPGTGKYIEAHYQCLGWFIWFFLFWHFRDREFTREISRDSSLVQDAAEKLHNFELWGVKCFFSSFKSIVNIKIGRSFESFFGN